MKTNKKLKALWFVHQMGGDVNFLDQISKEIESVENKVKNHNNPKISEIMGELKFIKDKLASIPIVISSLRENSDKKTGEIEQKTKEMFNEILDLSKELQKKHDKIKDDYEKTIEELKKEFEVIRKISIQKGGGSKPRQIQLAGTTVATRYSDINFIASGWSASHNDTTRTTDITVSGGGGTEHQEQTTDTPNDVLTTFAFAHTPNRIYANGIFQSLTIDYTVSGSSITFVSLVPTTGSIITNVYFS